VAGLHLIEYSLVGGGWKRRRRLNKWKWKEEEEDEKEEGKPMSNCCHIPRVVPDHKISKFGCRSPFILIHPFASIRRFCFLFLICLLFFPFPNKNI
jgi:hypothetical protein